MRLRICLDELDARPRTAGHAQISQRLFVDREEAAGRAIFRRHVADRRAVGKRQRANARPEELDETSDDAFLAQHLRDGEHEIGGGDAFPQLARQLEADDFRQQHGNRLAEHRGFRLDAADTPAEHGEAVDHGRVRIGADERIGIGELDRLGLAVGFVFFLVGPDRLGEIFQIDLMADAGARRHDAEIVERALAPFQEAIALAIALIFELDVLLEGFRRAEIVDDDGMIDDEIDRHERIDLLRIAAELGHRVAHRGQIDDGGNAGEILHEHARRPKGDLACRPCRDRRATSATAWMSSLVTERPSSKRSRFSRSTFIEKGRFEMPLSPFFSAVFSE